MDKKLTTNEHSRDVAGLKYVYPVVSRRAGGLSIGINFNTNNACNWRCIYCQVPDLVRGAAPEMDFILLEKELRYFLDYVLKGEFYDDFNVLQQHRVIKDIAISGNGEPTSLKQFDKAIALIGNIATQMQVLPESKFVLITNGSLMHLNCVQLGLKVFQDYQGQVWFKLDSATQSGRKRINDTKQVNAKTLENLQISSSLCETRLQSCLIDYLDEYNSKRERIAYLQLLEEVKRKKIKIAKVMLYTVARPSLQPEAELLSKVSENSLVELADKIKYLGYRVSISA
jgi:wyosine [tRNA(Phe)-imidazoG37] synthetase (radical SAM superfamily)